MDKRQYHSYLDSAIEEIPANIKHKTRLLIALHADKKDIRTFLLMLGLIDE